MNNDLLLGGGNIPNLGGGSSIDPRDYPTKKCSKCGGLTFVSRYIIKEIPGTLVGAGPETIVYPMKALVCADCGTIIDEDVKLLKLEKDLEDKKIIQ